MIGVRTIKSWNQEHRNLTLSLEKERRKLKELSGSSGKNRGSLYEIESCERRISSTEMQIRELEKKIINSWEDMGGTKK